MDTEAEPIREAHRDLFEKSLDRHRVNSAGTKKSGSNVVRLEELLGSWNEEALAAMFTMLACQDYALTGRWRCRWQDPIAVRELWNRTKAT